MVGRAVTLEAAIRIKRNGFTLDVALSAAVGETVAVLGPNGAGKTTLLRALAGLEDVEGRVTLDGEVLDDTSRGVHVPAEKRRAGLVFQDHVLFPHLSVIENVAFGLRAQRQPRAADVARKWIDEAGLGDRAEALPRELSGGQAQRVALLRALATGPKLLLLDEPLSSLDVSIRAEVRRELTRQLASFNGVRLLVTHDPLEAMALADRLVVLEHGLVVQSGTPGEVTARPRSRFVADLAGVNLLRGEAHGDRVVLAGDASLAAPDAGEGDVFAVIHPRAVALYRTRPDGTPRNVWQGQVDSVDLYGERVRVRVSAPVPLVAEVTRAAVSELGLNPGASVWIAVKATEVSVYPA
ncbi:MAG: ABC transporter ATP-binding protein [Chloroflexi bacterium 13_1_40CM_3_65_12]|nr:MAG: ABC transporter ATP-binding protein [Chloroflexi bacterium 13_1_40CM_4_65_13]OLD26576.1 MAG: ABC transporter ATP-binding protein [Chloroflexi bacterium 13_1_40CM_3_65_12]